jgi:hypothetical protein
MDPNVNLPLVHVISSWYPDSYARARIWPPNTPNINSLQLLSLGTHEGKPVPIKAGLTDGAQSHGCPTVLEDYGGPVPLSDPKHTVAFGKFYSKTVAILSTKDKLPCLGACIRVQICTVM